MLRATTIAFAVMLLCLAPSQPMWAWPQEFLAIGQGNDPLPEIAKAWGLDMQHAGSYWSRNGVLAVQKIACTSPAGIVWPGERPSWTFQFTNLTDQEVRASGVVRVLQYELYTKGDDVFRIGVRRLADCGTAPITVVVAPKGWADVTVAAPLPERKGGYALIIELEGQGALFGAGAVRTFRPQPEVRRFYRLTMDMGEIDVLTRLGVTQNRINFHFKPVRDPDFEAWYERHTAVLRKLREARLPVCVEFGAGEFRHPCQPLGRPRPWLDDQDQMRDTKFDLAWLPEYDADMKALAKRVALDYGWPKGPVNAIKLWNEPWNGISISGWGADDERYREIWGAICAGVEEARAEGGVQVLLGGCDSSSNTLDKLFADGRDTWLHRLDFLSIHYQGNQPASTMRMWRERTAADGTPHPVLIWDTESWVANSDERVAGVLASMFAFGHDRVVGIEGDNVLAAIRTVTVHTPHGQEHWRINHTWSVGAAVGAFQHFVGERPFRELLFRPGLPHAMLFTGASPDDATVVVLGDQGPLFGYHQTALRTARSLAEAQEKAAWRAELDRLPNGDPRRAELQQRIDTPQALRGCTMTIAAGPNYGLFDFYGNPVPAENGRITVPLDARGFYLRTDGSPGSGAALVAAVRAGRLDGLMPTTLQALDSTAPIGAGAAFAVRLTNVLNRPVRATVAAKIAGLELGRPQPVDIAPGAEAVVPLPVLRGAARADNRYPARIVVDYGPDGRVEHREDLRCNVIGRGAIAVDGKLDDWAGAIPQPVEFAGRQEATLTEKAWLPFMPADESIKKGSAVAWLAYDDAHLFFAARIADTTPHPGVPRFADNRHWDDYFYPEVAYVQALPTLSHTAVRWTGQLVAPEDGTYTIAVLADDGVRLWVDGTQLVDAWKHQGPTWYEGRIDLRQGERYELRLEYFQGGGGARLQLAWTTPKGARETIPASALATGAAAAPGSGLVAVVHRGTNFDARAFERIDTRLDFTWEDGPLSEASFGPGEWQALRWPEGVRRFSYRKDPILPCGNAPNLDNVQLGFGVLAPEARRELPAPPGTYPGFINVSTTDYEYALNRVHERWGGGTELWRLRRPDMPHKHFYPRQPASPNDGPVPDGRLAIVHEGSTRVVECAIPWAELPEMHAAMRAGRPVFVTYRVNDDAGVGCLELPRGRSASKRGAALFADWVEHWENTIAFGWGR